MECNGLAPVISEISETWARMSLIYCRSGVYSNVLGIVGTLAEKENGIPNRWFAVLRPILNLPFSPERDGLTWTLLWNFDTLIWKIIESHKGSPRDLLSWLSKTFNELFVIDAYTSHKFTDVDTEVVVLKLYNSVVPPSVLEPTVLLSKFIGNDK